MTDDMIGKRFCRLIVVKKIDDYVSKSGGKHKRYSCICDCGKCVSVLKEHLTSGRQKSCGCLRKENGIFKHGEIDSRLYKIWGNMCNRCSNTRNPAWERYGGRGIKVCDGWKEYINFKNWALKNGYSDSLSIDRINNDGDYEPNNCRWVDKFVQANNKRSNHIIKYGGETKTLSEWAKHLNISYKVLFNRVKTLNWDIEKAFTQPVRKSPKK